MRSAWVVAVLVFVVCSASAWAQFGATPEAMGMGTAVIGMAGGAAAWGENPAGLAALNDVPVMEGREWGAAVLGGYSDLGGSTTAWGGSVSAWSPAKHVGVGVGGLDISNGGSFQIIGAGVGVGLSNIPLSVGVNVMDFSGVGSATLVNAGLMYRFEQAEKAPIRVGLTLMDLTDEFGTGGPIWNAGIGLPAAPNLTLAVDVLDISEEMGSVRINGGVEYRVPLASEVSLRAGIVELFPGSGHDVTLGAGYSSNNWHVDGGWINGPGGDFWSLGAGLKF